MTGGLAATFITTPTVKKVDGTTTFTQSVQSKNGTIALAEDTISSITQLNGIISVVKNGATTTINNIDKLDGLHASDIIDKSLGNPVITPLIDWTAMAAKKGSEARVSNSSTGGYGYGGDDASLRSTGSSGDIYFKQSYMNFDEIIVVCLS